MKLLLVILSCIIQLPCIFAGWLWANMLEGWRDGVRFQAKFTAEILKDLRSK